MRITKFNVSFAFTSQDGTIQGAVTKEVQMSKDGVEFFLRALSPMGSDNWVRQLNTLTHRNSSMYLKTMESNEMGKMLLKVYKIVRV